MRKFQIEPGGPPTNLRAVVGGGSGSGKSTFAATAPRPLFLADNFEQGFEAIKKMDPETWWDPKVRPTIWSIEAITDVNPAITELETMARSGKFPYRTIVFDPISIYCDRFLTEMPQPNDRRQLYGDLNTHLLVLIRRLHALPAHILWLSHVKEGELTIPGQMSEKLPAVCETKLLCEVVTDRTKPPVWQIRTKPSPQGKFVISRHDLPETLMPSFKCIVSALQMKERPVSPHILGPDGNLWLYE